MTFVCRVLAVFLILAASAEGLVAQEAGAPPAAMLFHFQREETHMRYSLQMQSDGIGTYWEGAPDFQLEEATGARRVMASAATLKRIFAATADVQSGACETHGKDIAQTGRKTLMLLSKGTPRCEFNYSDSEKVNAAAKAFAAMAETLRMGQKIAHDRRFDHLGLNADLEALTAEAKSGDAIELQNIAPVLRSITDDEDFMDVVRRRAQSLLQDSTLGVAKKQ